jgi:hypothetical protein
MHAIRVLSVSIAVAVTSLIANAQTFHKVTVHLPYTVMVGSKELAPGDYQILPTPGATGSNIFGIYSEDRATFEALLTASIAEKSEPADATELVLRGNGQGDYTIDQIWIEGNTEGYQFRTPKSESRERQASTVEVKAQSTR